MSDKPHRRWFQFRLSTWLVLAEVMAWAMAGRPWEQDDFRTVQIKPGQPVPRDAFPAWDESVYPNMYNVRRRFFVDSPLVYPAAALLAFIAWKSAWRLAERRREREKPERRWSRQFLRSGIVLPETQYRRLKRALESDRVCQGERKKKAAREGQEP